MRQKDYTPRERGVLITLMAEARRLSMVELRDRFKLELTRTSREKLKRAGLIEVGKAKNPATGRDVITLELADSGWAWASREITEAPPTGYGALYAVLNNLARFMKRRELILADVFGRTNEPTPLFAAEPKTNGVSEDLEAHVRRAYLSIAKQPGDRIEIADLRERMSDVPRDTLDRELKRLVRAQRILVEPNDNTADVTPRDHEAALRLGGEQNHLMAVL